MRVKICGLTNLKDALFCEQSGAHALGFVFYVRSPRYIDPEKAGDITSRTGPFIQKVGVFVDESVEQVNRAAAAAGLSMVQLHGEESPEYIRQIRVPVIKAFRVDADFDFDILDQYSDCFILLDSHSEKGYGGTGEKFEWSVIPDKIKPKLILAGGVSSENIAAIYRHVRPAAVDLSSALESEPGVKDHAKVLEFMGAVRALKERVY